MRVSWKKTNVKTIPTGQGTVTLVPGQNSIPDHVWNRIKNMSSIKRSMERGHLDVPKSPDETIGEMETRKALRTIEATNGADTLRRYRSEAKGKPRVLQAIDEKLQLIEGGNDERSEGDTDGHSAGVQ